MRTTSPVHEATHHKLLTHRRPSDFVLFGVTVIELAILMRTMSSFTFTDWIYVGQHFIVLAIAFTRPAPRVVDRSLRAAIAVAVAYVYPYAQVLYLQYAEGVEVAPEVGFVLVTLAAGLSLTSLLTLGRHFGVRPASRGLVTRGPYRFVRHPMYLAYVVSDIGYNLQEGSWVTVLIVIAGWASLVYRIVAEERALATDGTEWLPYAERVRWRLVPGVW